MKNDNWNKHVMDGILAVNRNLHKGGFLPEKAQRLLYGLASCLPKRPSGHVTNA